jgi:hypothetical protein
MEYFEDLCHNDGQIIVYVGVGCTPHQYESDKNNQNRLIYNERKDQEYPLFLRTLKKKYNNMPLYLFLIDPSYTSAPFIVTTGEKNIINDNFNCDSKSDISSDYENKNDKIYRDQKNNITVYQIIKYALYNTNELWHCADTSKQLQPLFFQLLNLHSINKKWLTFVCDYTGKRTNDLRLQFSESLQGHYDHIIYGYFADDKKVSTCMIDTTSKDCMFIDKFTDNRISILNPFEYSLDNEYGTKLVNKLHEINDEKEREIFRYQVTIFFDHKREELNTMRLCLVQLQNAINTQDPIQNWSVKYFNIYGESASNLVKFDLKKYEMSFEVLIHKLKNAIKTFTYVIYHEDTDYIVEDIIKTMLKEKDPYKWSTYINNIMFEPRIFFSE